jgi:tetratricopeptide (TPR) repeat protein
MVENLMVAANVRRLASVLVVVVIAIVAFVAFGKSSQPSSAAQSRVFVTKGVAAERKGDLVTAADYYLKAIGKTPRSAVALYDLGTVRQQQGRTGRAAVLYRRAIALYPNFPRALFNLALIESKTNYKSAEQHYRKVISLVPNSARAQYNLGMLLINHGRKAEGAIHVDLALTMNPNLKKLVPKSLGALVHINQVG